MWMFPWRRRRNETPRDCMWKPDEGTLKVRFWAFFINFSTPTAFTGIDSPYEAPIRPEIHLNCEVLGAEEAAQEILAYLESKMLIWIEPGDKFHKLQDEIAVRRHLRQSGLFYLYSDDEIIVAYNWIPKHFTGCIDLQIGDRDRFRAQCDDSKSKPKVFLHPIRILHAHKLRISVDRWTNSREQDQCLPACSHSSIPPENRVDQMLFSPNKPFSKFSLIHRQLLPHPA